MTAPLKTMIHTIWKTNVERRGTRSEFKPVTIRYVGVEDARDYDNLLATIKDKSDEHTVIFDNSIPFQPEFKFMTAVQQGLNSIDLANIKDDDLMMFDDVDRNKSFTKAVQETLNLAFSQETFANESIKVNFVTKFLLHINNHIKNVPQADPLTSTNKCIYYGNIDRQDAYLLHFLSKFGWDVLYINPNKDLELTDLGELHNNTQLLAVESFAARAGRGTPYRQFDSITLGFEQEVEDEMFTGSGLFRPWQFRNGTTAPILFNATLIDLENNWPEDARVRQGFSVTGKTVQTPVFFYEVEGENDDYNNFVEKLKSTQNTIVVRNTNDVLTGNDTFLELSFCMLNDGTFATDRVKSLDVYPYEAYNDSTEDFILSKINEVILDKTLLTTNFTQESAIRFVSACLQLQSRVIQAIDSYDFPFRIPKILYFLENQSQLLEMDAWLLAFFHKLGFDVVVLAPAGMSNLTSFISSNRVNVRRLDRMNYDRTLSSIQPTKPKVGVLKRLFGRG